MKIRSIEIENFRCHKNTLIQECADFHTLFGGNATGKTYLIRSVYLLKSIGDRIDNPKDLLHNGPSRTGSKKIRISLLLEVEKEERDIYLADYFNLSSEQIGQNPKILEKIALEFTVMCGPEDDPAGNSDNHLILTKVQISDSKGNLFPILLELPENPTKSFLAIAKFERGSREFYLGPSLDEALTKRIDTSKLIMTPVEFLKSGLGFFQRDIVKTFVDNLSFAPDEVWFRIEMPTSDHEDGENRKDLYKLMNRLYQNDRIRYDYIEQICLSIYPEITSIRPKLSQNDTIEIIIQRWDGEHVLLGDKKNNFDLNVDMLAMIWKIGISKHSLWFIDEPGERLNKEASKSLYQFLRSESKLGKQIIVATRRPDFSLESEVSEVTYLFTDDKYTIKSVLLADILPLWKKLNQIDMKELEFRLYVRMRICRIINENLNLKKLPNDTVRRIIAEFIEVIVSKISSDIYREHNKMINENVGDVIKSTLLKHGYSDEQTTTIQSLIELTSTLELE